MCVLKEVKGMMLFMNILNSLRKVWLGIGTTKDKSVGVKSIGIENTNKAKSEELVSYDDSSVFEDKLDEILNGFGQNDVKHRDILLDFVYDIVNRDSQVYSNFSDKPNFKYSIFINNNIRNHHFEAFYGDQKVMVIDAATLMGDVLKFYATYRTDISDYFIDKRDVTYYSNLGTIVLKFDCLEDGVIELDTKIYTLDLLSGIEYSDRELNANMLSEQHSSLGESRLRR